MIDKAPLNVLLDYEARVLARRRRENIARSDINEGWQGLGLRLANQFVVCELDLISEIIVEPPYTDVPGVQNWFMGVANVRGNLLPLSDFSLMVTGVSSSGGSASRIVVVGRESQAQGLRVDEVLGIRRFEEGLLPMPTMAIREQAKPFFDGVFMRRSQTWGRINLNMFVNSDWFLNVAR